MSGWLRSLAAATALRAYRMAGSTIYPFAGILLRRRAKRGKEDSERRYERYGYASYVRPEGPVIWLHAASVGESLAILPLIKRLEDSGINLVVTTGTVTSAEMLKGRLGPGTLHQYVPLDLPKAVARFIDYWKPDLAIFAESELWPTTIAELHARQVPQFLVNARMSDRSDKRWRKRPELSRRIFGKLAIVTAQSSVDAQRFRQLGAPYVVDVGNLKLDAAVPVFDASEAARLKAQIGGRPTWLALSTHADEESIVAQAHNLLAEHRPDALTILAPRHPQRADEVAAALDAAGLSYVRRSSGSVITSATSVYLADTIGETGLFLQLANIALLGRSLGNTTSRNKSAAQGGQNPVEPVLTGAAVLSGRYVQNFRDTYQALLENEAASLVEDAPDIAAHVLHLWSHPGLHSGMTTRAEETIAGLRGALDRTMQSLDPFIAPLQLKAQLDRRATRHRSTSIAAQ